MKLRGVILWILKLEEIRWYGNETNIITSRKRYKSNIATIYNQQKIEEIKYRTVSIRDIKVS